MKMELKRPCAECPFRADVLPYLKPERCEDILSVLFDQDGHFTCHKTLDNSKIEQQHCAGS